MSNNDRHDAKLAEFKRLHTTSEIFIAPNAWDAGTARILESIGFPALATTSAGLAFSMGVTDSSGSLTRAQVLENAKSIVEATSLPVSADLENGFGVQPDDCALTIRQAEAIGLCGGALEDASGDPENPIYDFELAVERIRVACAAKTKQNFHVTARAENFLYGRPDLEDTIRRLRAFEQAGADVVYAPGLPDIDAVKAVCQSVNIPVNVVVGLTDTTYDKADLAAVGVRRISTGGSLARAALGEMIRGASELKTQGTYRYAANAIPDAEAAAYMKSVPD
ncbi:isocitrate lyase/PEP mutase family protein [Roseobacter sp. EG26]|uniref:isocitrate lyase/PEP mutase family protein n=1 Tax=Roseobacter sp. EG26 TaxID=3412477 RepID=UPI003CE521B7